MADYTPNTVMEDDEVAAVAATPGATPKDDYEDVPEARRRW
jgi:hypothetical protein